MAQQHVVFKLIGGGTFTMRTASGVYLQLLATAAALPPVVWVSNPSLTGTAKVGSVLTVVSGVYTNATSVKRNLIRVKNGVTTVLVTNIANGATYTVVAADDLATLSLVETAEGGSVTLTTLSAGRAITWPLPVLSAIPNQGPFVQDSGIQSVDLSSYATGGGLDWSVIGPAGIEVEDGVMTIPTTLTQAGVSATVTIHNSGGSAQRSFTITVTDKAPISSGVAFNPLSFTQNSGTKIFAAAVGFTGANIAWSLVSPPGGVTIDAATGDVSIVTTSLISVQNLTIRATNGGGALNRTVSIAVVAVTGTAPTLSGTAIPDKIGLIRGTTATTQATAMAFSGSVDSYAVVGAGMSIDSATGLLTFPKTATQALQTVTVTAKNAFGEVSATFRMSCMMQTITPADLVISWRTDKSGVGGTDGAITIPAGFFTWHADLREGNLPEAVKALWWRPDAHAAGTGPGTGYHPMIRTSPVISKTALISNATPAVFTVPNHGLENGVVVRLTTTGTLPAPFALATDYFVVGRTDTTFRLALASGGAAIATTTAGSGVHTITSTGVLPGFTRWAARRCTELTGAPMLKAWLDVVGSNVARTPPVSRTHNFIWSASDPSLNPLTQMEFSGPLSFLATISVANPAVITSTGHGLANGTPIRLYTTGTLPTGLTSGTTYYVVGRTANTFQLSATLAGTAIATTVAGSGVHTVIYDIVQDVVLTGGPAISDLPTLVVKFGVTISIASPAIFTATAHGLSNGHTVTLESTGTLPTGFTAGTTYYVVSKTDNTFRLSATSGGSAIAATLAGSGTHTAASANIVGTIGRKITALEPGVVTGDPTPTVTRAYLLSSTATPPVVTTGSTTIEYTPVAADTGRKLAYQMSAASTGGVAAALSTPSINVGAGVFATPTTAAEYRTALLNASAGDIIEIGGGDKNWPMRCESVADQRSRTTNVIIRAADPGNPPTFVCTSVTNPPLVFKNWTGLTFDGLNFRNEVDDLDDKNLDNNAPCALYPTTCNKFTMQNCRFDGWWGAFESHGGGDDFTFAYNEVRRQTCDGIRNYNLRYRFWCHHNKIWDTAIRTDQTSYTGADGFEDRHPDLIQFAATSGSGASVDAIVEDNYLECLQTATNLNWSEGMHGIALFTENAWKATDAAGVTKWSHVNPIVRRNHIVGATSIGIGTAGIINGLVSDNYMQRAPGRTLFDESRTPCVYPGKVAGQNKYAGTSLSVINNSWPLIYSGSTPNANLQYGVNIGQLAGDGSITKPGMFSGQEFVMTYTGNIKNGTPPVGWSGFDVAKGKYGPYGNG